MASVLPAPRFTVKEYLALEAVAETRHEFTGGQIVAMAGAELAHNQVVQNVRAELATQLGEKRCRILGGDQRVKVEELDEYFYPDVLVTFLEPQLIDPRPRSLVNPEVIVEVLSETTAGDKWLAYRTIPTLTDYVMVSSTRREIEHWQRVEDGTWTFRALRDRGACVLSNGATLDLGKLYRLVPDLA
jgi:Uma2 family endonuclease